MALAVVPSLIGVYSPRTVQIVITGMTVGETYSVAGNRSGGTWPVRAGTGTAQGTQLVLPDIATPVNVPITYTVIHDGQEVTSAPLTVPYAHRAVLQSLSAAVSVPLDLRDNGAPWTLSLRQSTFAVPRRPRPAVRYDIAAGESGALRVNTDGADTGTLKALLKSGAPLLMRTDGTAADLGATAYLLFTRVSSSLLVGTRRRWDLDYELLDDPEPDTLVGLPTWADFDAAYDGLTWADFNAEWAGLTWADFDTYDWATRAAA